MKYLNFANPVSGNGKPEFLMTLIDLSPSMDDDDWKPTRKAGAIAANTELIKAKAKCHPQDKLGIIGFSRHAWLLHDPVCLRNGTESLLRVLENPSGGYSTNFTDALELAESCLFDVKRKPTNKFFSKMLTGLIYEADQDPVVPTNPFGNGAGELKRIILLTDGEHNGSESPQPMADRLKNAGVVIDCIGIGGTPTDVDEQLLNTIASRNSDGTIRYCFIGDQQALIRKYETLARHIRPA